MYPVPPTEEKLDAEELHEFEESPGLGSECKGKERRWLEPEGEAKVHQHPDELEVLLTEEG